MVTDVAFNSRAHDFITNEMTFDNTLIAHQDISPSAKEIEVSFIGDEITKEQLDAIEKRLKYYTLENVKLIVHQPSSKKIDIASLKTSLLKDLYSTRLKTSEEKDKHVQALENQLAQIKAEEPDSQSIARELHTQYPMLLRAALAKTPLWRADGSTAESSLIAYLEVNKTIPEADQNKIIAWLKIRTNTEHVRLLIRRPIKIR
jgi:hypothetical protein